MEIYLCYVEHRVSNLDSADETGLERYSSCSLMRALINILCNANVQKKEQLYSSGEKRKELGVLNNLRKVVIPKYS